VANSQRPKALRPVAKRRVYEMNISIHRLLSNLVGNLKVPSIRKKLKVIGLSYPKWRRNVTTVICKIGAGIPSRSSVTPG
jgi:hypothetical protein